MKTYDVIIIGSGPTGLGIAEELEKSNIKNYVVLEREDHVGGIPYHCNHPTFGWISKQIPMTGPKFIKTLQSKIPQSKIKTCTTVLKICNEGIVEIHSFAGIEKIQGKRVVVCTGVRERSRAARLVSGMRPIGIFTTSALQQFVYINKRMPFSKPLIVGSEHVAFSALWTLRNAGIKPVAMIEKEDRIQTFFPLKYFGVVLGTNLTLNTRIKAINGISKVESVDVIDNLGNEKNIVCDSIIFCGDFVSENTLVRESHLKFTSPDIGPLVDSNYKTSDPYVYAAGNLLHPADMGDRCYLEGKRVAKVIIADLNRGAEPIMNDNREIELSDDIYHSFPSMLSTNDGSNIKLRIRVKNNKHNILDVKQGDQILLHKRQRLYMHRFYKLKINAINPHKSVSLNLK